MPAQVLVIEDDQHLRAEILDFLIRRRNLVRSCRTLGEAEQALSEIEPDVVVSDIHLPDGDGATFCMIHARRHPKAKWILMSGNQELVRQGNQLKSISDMPAFAVVDKPVPLRLLDRFIQAATPAPAA
jgi:DNA-binding NtrC family response regulator